MTPSAKENRIEKLNAMSAMNKAVAWYRELEKKGWDHSFAIQTTSYGYDVPYEKLLAELTRRAAAKNKKWTEKK
jgi:hypothetical protein